MSQPQDQAQSQALTLERMRADVAAVLGESADEIGVDDNLLDWGLDSMRVLGLVMTWADSGIPLELSHLAEHVTLAEWWRTVQGLQADASN